MPPRDRPLPRTVHAWLPAALACVLLPLTCCSSPVQSSATSTPQNILSTRPAAAQPTSANAPAPGTDALSRWALAAATLKAARTSAYTVTGTYGLGGDTTTLKRAFQADAVTQTLEVDPDLRDLLGGKLRNGLSARVLVGPRSQLIEHVRGSGQWVKASHEELALAGIDANAEVTGLPQMLESFTAKSDLGFDEISGTIDTQQGLICTGFGELLASDRTLHDSIGGSLYVKATFASNGDLRTVHFDGTDSTTFDGAPIWGGSKSLTEAQLIDVMTFSTAELVIRNFNKPLRMEVPQAARFGG